MFYAELFRKICFCMKSVGAAQLPRSFNIRKSWIKKLCNEVVVFRTLLGLRHTKNKNKRSRSVVNLIPFSHIAFILLYVISMVFPAFRPLCVEAPDSTRNCKVQGVRGDCCASLLKSCSAQHYAVIYFNFVRLSDIFALQCMHIHKKFRGTRAVYVRICIIHTRTRDKKTFIKAGDHLLQKRATEQQESPALPYSFTSLILHLLKSRTIKKKILAIEFTPQNKAP